MKSSIPKEIREKTDVPSVLVKLGIEYTPKNNELVARCISGSHPDTNPSWSIHNEIGTKKNGLFSCWSCGWSGDIFKLVMHMKGCSFFEALKFVEKHSDGNLYISIDDDRDLSLAAYMETFNTRQSGELYVSRLLGMRDIENGSACMKYLAERGIGREEIETYELRDWIWKHRVFVPITRNKKLVTWLARSYNGTNPKILFPKSDSVGSKWGLFGYDQLNRTNKTISLTEGWISAIRIVQAGFKNVLATNGAILSEEQVEELSWTDEIVIWKEGDIGGVVFEKNIVEWLGRGCELLTVNMPKGTDPADFIPSKLLKFYEQEVHSGKVY